MHAPTETSPPTIDISTPETVAQSSLEETTSVDIDSSEDIAHVIQEKTIPIEVFSFFLYF